MQKIVHLFLYSVHKLTPVFVDAMPQAIIKEKPQDHDHLAYAIDHAAWSQALTQDKRSIQEKGKSSGEKQKVPDKLRGREAAD